MIGGDVCGAGRYWLVRSGTMSRGAWLSVLFALLLASCGSSSGSESSVQSEPGPLAIGESGEMDGWTIEVVSVRSEDDIAPYEPLPGVTYDGFVVEVLGTYHGEGQSSIDVDFVAEYIGVDGRVYGSYDSRPDSLVLVSTPTVVAGGSHRQEFPLAIPVDARGGGKVTIEASFRPEALVWAVDI